MSLPALLKGDECYRFCTLVKKGIPYHVALQEARNPGSELVFPEEEMLNVLREYPDPWLYETVKANKSSFATDFRKAFRDRFDKGNTVKEAADAALRKIDTLAAARYGQTELRRTEAINLAKIRLAIANANGTRIAKDFYMTFMEKMRKTFIAQWGEMGTVPHIVDCAFMKRLGYIRVFCADKLTVRWLIQFVRSTQFLTPVTLFMMRERKFERSFILSTCLEDTSSDEVNSFLENLHKLNPDVDISKWKILTTQLSEDGKSLDVFTLLPTSDRKNLELKKYELQYKLGKIKFSVLTRGDQKGGKARNSDEFLLQGIFPDSVAEGDILELIESENEDIDTFRWKVITKFRLKGEGKQKYVWLQFYMDERSADVIEENRNQINFMSQKIKLYPKIRNQQLQKFKIKFKFPNNKV